MKPFSRNMESLNIYTISMYYTWSNSGFTHTNPRRPSFNTSSVTLELYMKDWVMIHKIKAMHDEGRGISIKEISRSLACIIHEHFA